MLTAFHSVALHRDTIITAIDKVARAGYDGIELNAETLPWAEPHVTPETSDKERRTIAAMTREKGMHVSSICAHIDMLRGDSQHRRSSIDFVLGCIDLAVDVDAPVVHILSGEVPEGMSREEAMEHFAQAVQEVVDYGRNCGVEVGVEAIVGMLFHSIDDYWELSRLLPNTRFRVNFDPSHLYVQGEDPLRLIAEYGEHLCNVHIKDGQGRVPNFSFPPLGQGGIDFDAIVKSLRDLGYDQTLSVEYEANAFGYTETETQILDGSRQYLSRLGF